jgi:hypothetical protein
MRPKALPSPVRKLITFNWNTPVIRPLSAPSKINHQAAFASNATAPFATACLPGEQERTSQVTHARSGAYPSAGDASLLSRFMSEPGNLDLRASGPVVLRPIDVAGNDLRMPWKIERHAQGLRRRIKHSIRLNDCVLPARYVVLDGEAGAAVEAVVLSHQCVCRGFKMARCNRPL